MRTTRWMGLWLLPALGLIGACSSQGDNDEVLPGVDAMVFAKRAFLQDNGDHNVAGGANRVVDYLRYTPGGGLFVLSPPTPDGDLQELTADFDEVDVSGLDLSFDATEVVFSMRHAGDDGHYHIYKANVDGSGRVKQLTFGPHDDVRPIFLPGERVGFVTNQAYTQMGRRADEYNHGRQVTQLATISIEDGDASRHVCSQNLSHSADPFLMSDGSIGFSRWEHLGPVNDVKLFRMNPDCTDMLAVAGQHGKGFNSIVQVREVEAGRYVGIATSREGTIQAGAVMDIDVRVDGSSSRFDEQQAEFTSLTPDVPTDREAQVPTGVGRYRSPLVLEDNLLLVSWANGDVSERNELAGEAPKFGIFLYDTETEDRVRVYDDPDTWDLYAMPVRPREEPPERNSRLDVEPDPSVAQFGAKAAVLGSIDVRQTSLSESVSGAQFDGTPLSEALVDTEKVRIIEGFSSEVGGVREFGLTMHEGAAILGEAEVQPDGSWEAHVVPYLPYHLQPIDRFGLAIRNQMLWIQAMPGENRTCGGCHESRAETALATQGATLAQQLPLERKNFSTLAIKDRIELPWYGSVSGGDVQELFDNKCVSCHDGGANDPFAGRSYTVTIPPEEDGGMELVYEVPYLLLTNTSLETYYEDDVVSYPASYVTLLYPSAMMGDSEVAGDVPDPPWVIPGSARESRLISKVNATPDDERAGTEWAWDTPAHPEDVGVELTPAERLILIRMADLGGQYYSRRNVEDAAMWLGDATSTPVGTGDINGTDYQAGN
ncbi:MAG: hypothetical protein OXT09_08900 [Myxococcales bacterium]|nr:hypothetical protein [Myxococcales bacterium]